MQLLVLFLCGLCVVVFLTLLVWFVLLTKSEAHVGTAQQMLQELKAKTTDWQIEYDELTFSKLIGKGSQGEVYMADWRGSQMAVKRVDTGEVDMDTIEEFCQEARMMRRLHHPNLTLFMGVSLRDPNLCIVTEYVSRGSLFDIMRDEQHNRSLTWPRALSIALDIARAMVYLHSYSPPVLHRDLKSLNILVDENWRGKVADFGMTRFHEDGTYMSQCGSPLWMSPEMIKRSRYNEKSDVYSFGIVLWELYTRKIPYRALKLSANKLVALVVRNGTRPTVPADCPSGYKKLMELCWAHRAKDRPSFVQIAKALEIFQQDTAIVSHVPNSNRKMLTAQTAPVEAENAIEYTSIHNWQIKKKDEIVLETDTKTNTQLRGYSAARYRGARVAVVDVTLKQPVDQAVFKRTMARLAHLRHPNLALFMGAYAEDNHVRTVMEYAPNGSLHGLLVDNGFIIEWNLMFRMFQDIAAGLLYLHQTTPPVFIPELNPHMLLFGSSWQVKITNVGLVDLAHDLNSQMPEAKSAWHAPEVLQSFRAESLSAAANVYTFGMLLWQIVSGEAYLFDGAACDADLVSEIVFDHKRPPIPEHIPTALKTLITQCWAADPQKRPHLDQVLSELAEMCELGPDKLELENGVNGARLYRKGITIRAFKSKDPITVVKDWGRSYGDAGCYICQSNAGQTEAKTNSTPEEQMLGDDVEIVDAKAFLNTYEQIPGGRPFEFRMVGNVLAKKMTHPFVVKHPRDGTFSQGLAGDYLVQKSTDDVWALEGAKFEKDFCLVEVED